MWGFDPYIISVVTILHSLEHSVDNGPDFYIDISRFSAGDLLIIVLSLSPFFSQTDG